MSTYTERTARRYQKSYLQAQQNCGDGFIGLLNGVSERGNRVRRIAEDELKKINDFIDEEYLDFKGMKMSQAYNLFLSRNPDVTVSYQTFRKCILNLETQTIIDKREGYKKGRAARPMVGNIDYGVPVHGSRVFEIAHLDHTQIDLEVFAGTGGESLRPWLTLMVDAYTRSVLAFSISLLHPGRLACMNILRECVLKHDRLPEILVVDGGKEFESIYFEQVCGRYEVEIKSRRCNPRKGAVVERMFGVTNSRLFHQMIGNTQQTKDPRGMTKHNNPKNLAIWKLEALEKVCAEFFYNLYANKIHVTTGEAPIAAMKRSIIADGARKYRRISDHETFFFETMIPVNQDTRVIQPVRGIKVQGNYYWCDEFAIHKYAGQKVPVKIDIFNRDSVVCYIGGKWVYCTCGSDRSSDELSKYSLDVSLSLTPSLTGVSGADKQSLKEVAFLISETEDKLKDEVDENKKNEKSVKSEFKKQGEVFGGVSDDHLDEYGEL